MQRRARTRLAGAALALAVGGGLMGCTGGAGDDAADTKPGDASAAAEPAPPGKFRTLPEPCGAVSRDTLEQMLPGAAAKAEEAEKRGENSGEAPSATPSPLDGEAALTYDTDRRAGCTWQSTTSLGSRQLTVDFERIVSYDPEVSDDEQAAELFAERAEKAGVAGFEEREPSAATGSATAAGDAPEASAAAGDGDAGSEALSGARSRSSKASSASSGSSEAPSPDTSDGSSPADGDAALGSPSPEPTLPPRTLEDIGDAAFIDDRLRTTADGHGSRRDIRLVFRTSNVLVTVEYGQSIADARRTPDSAELQKYAQNLARRLAERFSDT